MAPVFSQAECFHWRSKIVSTVCLMILSGPSRTHAQSDSGVGALVLLHPAALANHVPPSASTPLSRLARPMNRHGDRFLMVEMVHLNCNTEQVPFAKVEIYWT